MAIIVTAVISNPTSHFPASLISPIIAGCTNHAASAAIAPNAPSTTAKRYMKFVLLSFANFILFEADASHRARRSLNVPITSLSFNLFIP